MDKDSRRAPIREPRAPGSRQGTPWRLGLFLPEGCLDTAVGATLSIVQTVNALNDQAGLGPAIALTLATPGGELARTAGGLIAKARPLPRPGACDQVVVPGIFARDAGEVVDWLRRPAQQALIDALGAHARADAAIAASCAGTWAMAETGLLAERQATTVWWLAPKFRQRYPRVRLDARELVVNDAGFTTAGAAMAHTDLMLHLVARRFGVALAERCARLLMAEFRQLQSRHLKMAWLADADPDIARAQRWIDRRLGENLTVSALAEHLGMTPRTLARRCHQTLGMSPVKLIQRQRVEAALDLLRHTTLPFGKVAARVGYADPGALRRLMAREFGEAPVRRP